MYEEIFRKVYSYRIGQFFFLSSLYVYVHWASSSPRNTLHIYMSIHMYEKDNRFSPFYFIYQKILFLLWQILHNIERKTTKNEPKKNERKILVMGIVCIMSYADVRFVFFPFT